MTKDFKKSNKKNRKGEIMDTRAGMWIKAQEIANLGSEMEGPRLTKGKSPISQVTKVLAPL